MTPTAAQTAAQKPEHPNFTRPELVKALPTLELVDDLLEGTEAMHARAERYLPKFKAETTTVWAMRSKAEALFEGFSRSHNAAVGMLYAVPPSVDFGTEAASQFEGDWDDIDGRGSNGLVWAKNFTDRAVRDGVSVIVVDAPPPPVDEDGNPVQVDAALEAELGVAPFWRSYNRRDVVSWRVEDIRSREFVRQVVFRELGVENDDAFGVTTVERYRRLFVDGGVAQWEVYEQNAESKEWRVIDSGTFTNTRGETRGTLPIAVAYTGRYIAPFVASFPLGAVAHLNLSHYQLSSGLKFYLTLSAFPQPVVTGTLQHRTQADGSMGQGKLGVGPLVVIHLKEGGTFEWAELSGSALDRIEAQVERKERQMSKLGAAFLSSDTRAAQTAESKRLDATAQNATLGTMAQGLDDAFAVAWAIHAWYRGVDKDQAPMVQLSREFEEVTMSPEVMRAYVEAVKSAGFPVRLLLEAWQAGGRIPNEADLDSLELEILAGQAGAPPSDEPPEEPSPYA